MVDASGVGRKWLRMLGLATCGAGLVAAWASEPAAAQSAGTLERIQAQGEIRLAYREDAAPFSFVENGAPAGYSVNLCREVAHALQQELKLPELTVTFVPVVNGQAELLCEATSATLSRRARVDFSISTFISGASLAIRPDGPTNLKAMAGQKIGVLGGTTTQEDLDITLREEGVTADVIVVKTHDEGLDLLQKDEIAAYFADRTILQDRLRHDAAGDGLLLADNYLTIEPYALAMPIDHAFRLAVDRALSRLFRTGGMIKVFRKSVDPEAKPSELLKALSRMSGLPE
jgi:polar amino acid transport system substrate-binding protein/glutamate/aspartate transport system substrate-binding protein